jgi:hypothetical protein
MPTVVEDEEEATEENTNTNINNTAGYFLAVAGVAVTMPPKQSTPAIKKAATGRGHGEDDSCSSSYTDEAGDDDHDMDDLEEEVPDVVSHATMSKQQSEDQSNAESRGSGSKTQPHLMENEIYSDENLTEAERTLQPDEHQDHDEGQVNGSDHKTEELNEEELEEAKETLADIMAKRKIAGNKGWSALSKTLKERKSELFEAAVRLKYDTTFRLVN